MRYKLKAGSVLVTLINAPYTFSILKRLTTEIDSYIFLEEHFRIEPKTPATLIRNAKMIGGKTIAVKSDTVYIFHRHDLEEIV